MYVKLGDFGSIRIISNYNNENLNPLVGTKWYKVPEIIFVNKIYDKIGDICSFGCLMAELFLES